MKKSTSNGRLEKQRRNNRLRRNAGREWLALKRRYKPLMRQYRKKGRAIAPQQRSSNPEIEIRKGIYSGYSCGEARSVLSPRALSNPEKTATMNATDAVTSTALISKEVIWRLTS